MEKDKNHINLNIISTAITLIIGILTIIVTCTQCSIEDTQKEIAKSQESFANLTKPISYEFDFQPSEKIIYELEQDGRKSKITAYIPVIKTTSGGIKKLIAICYDGKDIYSIDTLYTYPKWSTYNISITNSMSDELLYDEEYVYDYFFLYIESVSGEKQLELIWFKIDIDKSEVSEVGYYSKYDILRLESSKSSNIQKKMLLQYQSLLNKMSELNYFE